MDLTYFKDTWEEKISCHLCSPLVTPSLWFIFLLSSSFSFCLSSSSTRTPGLNCRQQQSTLDTLDLLIVDDKCVLLYLLFLLEYYYQTVHKIEWAEEIVCRASIQEEGSANHSTELGHQRSNKMMNCSHGKAKQNKTKTQSLPLCETVKNLFGHSASHRGKPRIKEWGNRFCLLMEGIVKSPAKGKDTGISKEPRLARMSGETFLEEVITAHFKE